jgi:hypothetical protein
LIWIDLWVHKPSKWPMNDSPLSASLVLQSVTLNSSLFHLKRLSKSLRWLKNSISLRSVDQTVSASRKLQQATILRTCQQYRTHSGGFGHQLLVFQVSILQVILFQIRAESVYDITLPSLSPRIYCTPYLMGRCEVERSLSWLENHCIVCDFNCNCE